MKKVFSILLTLCLLLTSAAFAEGTIKIAVAADMTGPNAEYGIGFARAAKLMAKQWNEKQTEEYTYNYSFHLVGF